MRWLSEEKSGQLKRNNCSLRMNDSEMKLLCDVAYRRRVSVSELVRETLFGEGRLTMEWNEQQNSKV